MNDNPFFYRSSIPNCYDDLVTNVNEFKLPPSSFLSHKTLRRLMQANEEAIAFSEQWTSLGPETHKCPAEEVTALRRRQATLYYQQSCYINMTRRYCIKMSSETLSGVHVEIFTPDVGVAKKNKDKVLINLHGGAFIDGMQTISHLESIPISAVGRIKVISVDYRLAPEYKFPAGVDDVVEVYRSLLPTYEPHNIGIYGCSAGALLTSQFIARLEYDGLPLPGAIGMVCASSHGWHGGDSSCIAAGLIEGYPIDGVITNNIYLDTADEKNPLVLPGSHPKVLAKFPPSLLLGSTRDFALSSVVKAHSDLVRVGVTAELYVWEGLGHVFLYDSEIPESREAYDVMVKFFARRLGK